MQGAHGLAGKWHPYEESIRVPLIIRDPRMPPTKRGTLDDSFTLNIDLAQTILGAANVNPSSLMQGRDISELYYHRHSSGSSETTIKGTNHKKKKKQTKERTKKETTSVPSTSSPWRQDFFYELPLRQFPDSTAVVTKEWKYVKWPSKGNYEQLFYLPKDPYELNDLLRPLPHRNESSRRSSSTIASTTTTGFEPEFIEQILGLLRKRYDQLKKAATTSSPNTGQQGVGRIKMAKCEQGRKYDGT
jgi:arylsulfatase A-like enzyme